MAQKQIIWTWKSGNKNNIYAKKKKKSQQKQALFQTDKRILQLTSTSRLDNMEIKGGAQKTEKERFITEQCTALAKSLSTKCSIQKVN